MTAQTPATPAIPATMKAVVMRAPGDVVVEEVDTPRVAQPTDVVLKLAAACVCGSDLWPYRGHNKVDHRRMGHEYVGTIVEKGEDVATLEVGDFVIGSFMLSDNTCEICQAGYQSRCVNAGEYTGSQAQYMRVELADGSLVKVPGGEPSDPDRLADYVLWGMRFLARGPG
ncbi:alcohol dehydrogenase catalytic domain-containing protein [Micrococcus luteus]|uniref:alcohol dehydrogenase catalytic domain-containing protein n=1 Tax=Micrococcus luteus TaxID=1270 RepID=UPI003650F20C